VAKYTDTERLEFMLAGGFHVSWCCREAKCFVYPHTEYHTDPRAAIDEVMDKFKKLRKEGRQEKLEDWEIAIEEEISRVLVAGRAK
jgi:hypothetical protein